MKILVFCGFLAICSATPCWAQEWGDLNLKFIVEGKVPEPWKLAVERDEECCGKQALFDETIVVGKGGGLANVVMFIKPALGAGLPIHPSYAESANATIAMEQEGCRFQPHIIFLRDSQEFAVRNKDAIAHSAMLFPLRNEASHHFIPAGKIVTRIFTSYEPSPVRVSCAIHPWMQAYLVIRSEPYGGVSDGDGALKIANLPTGKWNFSVWHESRGFLKSVKIGGKEVVWPKGQVEFEITKDGGKTPLEIGVPVETLLPSK